MNSTKTEPAERTPYIITVCNRNGAEICTEWIKARTIDAAKRRARAIARRERVLVGSFYITDEDGIGVSYGEIGQNNH